MTRSCLVCGCTESHACSTEHGPCAWINDWLCSACAAAAPHIVSMRIDWNDGEHGANLAVCACGWQHRQARVGPAGVPHPNWREHFARIDEAIRAHRRDVVRQAAEAAETAQAIEEDAA